VRKRERTQNQRIADCEARGVQTQREGQRGNDDRRHARGPLDPPPRFSEVAPQRIDQRQATAIPIALLGLIQTAEGEQGLPPRLGGGQTGADVVLDVEVEVALQLVGQITIAVRSGEQAQEPRHRRSKTPQRALHRPQA
jgi:hypothetical protein